MTEPAWQPAYVALGSNLDDPPARIQEAFAALATLPATRLVSRSRYWHTAPVGPQDQPQFVNAVAGLLTQLSPEQLHAALASLERALGKVPPAERWGPRRIDLDLLLVGDAARDTAALVLPHPRMHERAFVLYPLADVAPALHVPGRGRVEDLKRQVSAAGIEPLEPPDR